MTIPVPISPPTPPAPEGPPVPETRRPSWWRGNRWALVALALLLPATAVGIGWHEWHNWFGFGARPVAPLEVESEKSVDFAGADWGPIRSSVVEDLSGLDVPEGSRVIGVGIPVDAGSDGVVCESPTLTQQSTGRSWKPVRSEIGLQYNPDEPELCTRIDKGSYELVVPFVIPDDVEGPFWVDVWPSAAGSKFVRFSIDP